MVKLLKQSSISLHFENTRGQRVDYKGTTNAKPGQRHSNKNIKPGPNERQYLPKPKDERTHGERVDDRLEAG